MSNLVKTEAVVLRGMKYRETSKIVTFYTREFGKIKAVAKGARRPKSKFGSALEPMSFVSLVLYKRDQRDLQLVSQCDLIKSLHNVHDDLERMTIGMTVVELVAKVSHGEERNDRLFGLLADTLFALNSATKHPRYLLYVFEIGLADVLGFRPEFGHCVVCKKSFEDLSDASAMLHVGKGGPLCPDHVSAEGLKVKLRAKSLQTLDQLSAGGLSGAGSMVIEKTICLEIENVLLGFLRYHVDGLQNLKSTRVLPRILS